MHPNYNPSTQPTDKLMDHLADLNTKLSYAIRMGNHNIANDIRIMIASINDILEERRAKEELADLEKQGIDVTEPITIGEIEEIIPIEDILKAYKNDK